MLAVYIYEEGFWDGISNGDYEPSVAEGARPQEDTVFASAIESVQEPTTTVGKELRRKEVA